MPKVVYSAAKGLHQQPGTGFEISDVPVLEEIQALSAPADAVVNPYGVTTFAITAAGNTATLAAPTSSEPAGTTKICTVPGAVAGGHKVRMTCTGGGIQTGGGALAHIDFDAQNETAILVSNGTKWVCISAVGATQC